VYALRPDPSTPPPVPVPDLRIRSLNGAAVRPSGDHVLYWMTATRRLSWNFGLDRALEHARALGRPLVILEPLNVDYRWASDRHHLAVIDGMAEHEHALRPTPVAYHPYVEPAPGAGRGLLEALAERACAVVTDDAPVFFTPRLLEAAGRLRGCLVEGVDSCGLLPLAAADRTFTAAYHLRRFLHKELPRHLGDRPAASPLAGSSLPPAAIPEEITRRWPRAGVGLLGADAPPDQRAMVSALSGVDIDHSVGPTGWRGGHAAARGRLDEFLGDGLARYGEERNDPDADASSRLSPWLHYGHLSVHEVFDALVRREGWSPARISPPHDGRRKGWWGMSEAAESFVDELVTWRELGYVYCSREPDYDRYDTLPGWALETLEQHASDPREHLYTLDEFAGAGTHDELWNAAQRQLVGEGIIHNYLRMLWGKKILEWTAHPREALDVMVELNNRYALDGRDPNSYSGIMWVLGRFDRGWPERAVFGKVRSMTSDSTRRKVRLDRYLERWGGQGTLL
jgi:deoxyribodipyrimidine photo-lyase